MLEGTAKGTNVAKFNNQSSHQATRTDFTSDWLCSERGPAMRPQTAAGSSCGWGWHSSSWRPGTAWGSPSQCWPLKCHPSWSRPGQCAQLVSRRWPSDLGWWTVNFNLSYSINHMSRFHISIRLSTSTRAMPGSICQTAAVGKVSYSI